MCGRRLPQNSTGDGATHIRFMVELQAKHEAARTREAKTEEEVGTYYSIAE